jgi:hypothetical protein
MRYHTIRAQRDRRYRRACHVRPAPKPASPDNPARAAAEARLVELDAAWAAAHADAKI